MRTLGGGKQTAMREGYKQTTEGDSDNKYTPSN